MNASASQLAYGNLSRTQRSKQQEARRVREAQGAPPGQQRLEELLSVRRGTVSTDSTIDSQDLRNADTDRELGFTSAGGSTSRTGGTLRAGARGRKPTFSEVPDVFRKF
jgi:hypothetical protein